MNRFRDPDDVNVVALVKDAERYVWLYRDCDRLAAMRSIGRFAGNPELSLTWYDAATLSLIIRKQAEL